MKKYRAHFTLPLNFLRGQVKGLCHVIKPSFMRPITEWLVAGPAAPAQRNHFPSLQTIWPALHVHNLKITLKP